MKRGVARAFLLLLLVFLPSSSWGFEDIADHPSCAVCGMDREEFGHSRMRIEYGDGTTFGLCSLRCAALILGAEEGKKPRSVAAADYYSRDLVEAEGAHWVIGGRKPGVMTRVPKWAFRSVEDAKRFLSEFGGRRSTYKEALEEAGKELE